MSKQNTTVIVGAYKDMPSAESDWNELETVAKEGVYVADAALVTKDAEGNPKALERQSHHGWGKGALVGAVVGLLFPPSIIAGAVIGGLAGGGIASLNRSLGREKIKQLGETLDKGQITLVAVVGTASVDTFEKSLTHAVDVHSEETGLTHDDLVHAAAA